MTNINYESISTNTEVDVEGRDTATSGNKNGNPHPQDQLAPPFDSTSERPSTLFVGAFNLLATIVGGSVLSLPTVFQKCGVAFSTVAMLLSAYMSYVSLTMLCYCGRRGGGSSYGEVVRSAFGPRMEEGMTCLLFVFLMFIVVAYMLLIRDIWTPLVLRNNVSRGKGGEVEEEGNLVLLAIVGLLLPLLFQRSLHALRYNCYIGFASIFLLCIALWRGGVEKRNAPDYANHQDASLTIEFLKMPSVQDALFSFPIVIGLFICHFNVIAVQNALVRPTRARMQQLLRNSIGASFLLMHAFGLGGYWYAGSSTEGNILLNVPLVATQGGKWDLFLLGRFGCGVTMMLAMPMIALPCREALLEIASVFLAHRRNHRATEEFAETLASVVRSSSSRRSSILNRRGSTILIRNNPIQKDSLFQNAIVHYGSTLLIIAVCYLGAVAVTGVAALWSFIGSSMAFLIGFVLPCGCFIVIETDAMPVEEGGDRKDSWIRVAWGLLAFSILSAVVCTLNKIMVALELMVVCLALLYMFLRKRSEG